MNCAYCGGPSEKEFSIDVNLAMYGDCDVWICNKCGRYPAPTVEELQERVEAMDPLVLELKLKRGEIGFVPKTGHETVTRLNVLPF